VNQLATGLAQVLEPLVTFTRRCPLFAETLKKVVDNVEGGIAAVIMGLDGIPVESYVRQSDMLDITTVAMEFSFILTQVRKAGESLAVGNLEELAVKAQRLLLVCRMLSPQYFVAICIAPEGNIGKARYLAKLATPTLIASL
jgi:predicted regulator of Ras-like GTPase activity (Roadblock/LC7/MglB family)